MASHVPYLLPFPAFPSGHLTPSVAGPLLDAKLGRLVHCLHLPSFPICRSPSPGSFHFLLIAQVMRYDQVFDIWVLSPIDWSLLSTLIENVALGTSKIQQVEETLEVEVFFFLPQSGYPLNPQRTVFWIFVSRLMQVVLPFLAPTDHFLLSPLQELLQLSAQTVLMQCNLKTERWRVMDVLWNVL